MCTDLDLQNWVPHEAGRNEYTLRVWKALDGPFGDEVLQKLAPRTMDPLSLTAGIIAIATVAGQACKGFQKLRALHKYVPGRLHALNNEVVDIEVVLYQLAALVRERESLPTSQQEQDDIGHLLERAKIKLQELRAIVDRLSKSCVNAKGSCFRGYRWQREQERLQVLQEDLNSIKCSLNIILGASSSRDMVRVRLDLENLSAVTAQSSRDQINLQDSLIQNVALGQQVDQRVGRVIDLLEAQSKLWQEGHTTQLGFAAGAASSHQRRRRTKHGPKGGSQEIAQSDSMGVRVLQHTFSCRPGCSCPCHDYKNTTSPAIVDRLLGQLFVGYAGLPFFSPKCSSQMCQKAQAPHVSFEYWFPLGFFWSQIFRVEMGISQSLGPQFQLKTLRRVPDSAPCVNFALEGNTPALKDLFVRGLASPQDVSSTRGYSLLRWALYGKQYETCQFLVHAGADIDYKPIAAHDDSPKNKACDFLLQGALSKDAAESLRCLTRTDDFIEEQRFTQLHRNVLGLLLLNLEQELQMHPDDVDATDAMGRTPLMWASARGDDRAVATLLSFKANPNILDTQFSGPLMYAAAQSHPICVRLLLEAGADPDPVVLRKLKRGNPLNVATRLGSDVLTIKTLLDFGADIESCGAEGRTSLIHAALNDDLDVATLLLEYNANINATSTTLQTPLTTAIIHNSHNVLRLLLDRWQEYSACPRLQGPNLLQLAAFYGDLETIRILTGVDHFALSYDKDYVASDFESRLRDRKPISEALIDAFAELLSIIKTRPQPEMKEDLAESGLLRQDSDLDRFEDAEEYHD